MSKFSHKKEGTRKMEGRPDKQKQDKNKKKGGKGTDSQTHTHIHGIHLPDRQFYELVSGQALHQHNRHRPHHHHYLMCVTPGAPFPTRHTDSHAGRVQVRNIMAND